MLYTEPVSAATPQTVMYTEPASGVKTPQTVVYTDPSSRTAPPVSNPESKSRNQAVQNVIYPDRWSSGGEPTGNTARFSSASVFCEGTAPEGMRNSNSLLVS